MVDKGKNSEFVLGVTPSSAQELFLARLDGTFGMKDQLWVPTAWLGLLGYFSGPNANIFVTDWTG